MSLAFAMLTYYDVEKAEHEWLIPFELPNIIYLLQVIYAWTTFVSPRYRIGNRDYAVTMAGIANFF